MPVLVQLLSADTGTGGLAWEAAEILAQLTDPASRAPSTVIAQPVVVEACLLRPLSLPQLRT